MKIERAIPKWQDGTYTVMCRGEILDECEYLGVSVCPVKDSQTGKWHEPGVGLYEVVYIPSGKAIMPHMGRFVNVELALDVARRLVSLTDWSRLEEELLPDDDLYAAMFTVFDESPGRDRPLKRQP